MSSMYPILLDISQTKIIVLGGGKIATRKISTILQQGGKPTVIAPEVTTEILNWSQQQKLELVQRSFQAGDLSGFQLIFICTNQPLVNQKIRQEVASTQWVNDTTNKEQSNFFNLALLEHAEVKIGLTSFGNSPKNLKKVRGQLQEFLKNYSE